MFKKVENIGVIIFLIVFLLIVGISSFQMVSLGFKVKNNSDEFEANSIKTQAIITSIETSYSYSDGQKKKIYDVYVKFTVDGVQYKGKLNTYNISMQEGEETTIYYNPDNPNEFRGASSTSLNISMILSSISGFLFSLVVVIFFIVMIRKKNRQNSFEG